MDFADSGIAKSGAREFQEETGFKFSRVLSCSDGRQFLDPGLTDDSCRIMLVEVDNNAPASQKLDTDEAIEVLTVECDKLLEFLDGVIERGEAQVEAKLYTFALGYEVKNKL